MSQTIKYKIQKGDTLSSIGKKYGVSYKDIAEENGIENPDLIYAGNELTITIPGQSNTATGTSTTPSTTPAANAGGATTPTTNNGGVKPQTGTGTVTKIYGQKPGDLVYSDIVNQADAALAEHMKNPIGDYTPVWLDEANAYLSKYENRDPFSYDFNSDALYNQYKDQYILQGQMAMMDTMGQAAAMTGGYGNSYAQTVGQQAYNQQLNQLNEIMPELYGMAYDRYSQEGQDLLNMYGIYMDKENLEYGKYQDNLDNWYKQLDYLTEDARYKRETEYDEWIDENDAWLKLQDIEYKKEQAAKTEKNANWNKLADLISAGHEPTAAEKKAAGMTNAEAKTLMESYTNSQKTGGNGTGSDPKYKDIDVGSEVYNAINTEVKRVGSLAQLQSLVQKYLALGYDPAQIDKLTADKAAELTPKDPERGYGKPYGVGSWRIVER